MSKIEKLCKAYEQFGRLIAAIPDEKAKELAGIDVRGFIAEVAKNHAGATPSQIAAGLEQGWRETPRLIGRVADAWRPAVAKAWTDATANEYPEFLTRERVQLQKILDRGKIRNGAEFYRVQHEIDVLTGRSALMAELQVLYALVEAYQSRRLQAASLTRISKAMDRTAAIGGPPPRK